MREREREKDGSISAESEKGAGRVGALPSHIKIFTPSKPPIFIFKLF